MFLKVVNVISSHYLNTGYYRAKLNDSDRLLFQYGTAGGVTCLLILEIIRNHNYRASRFLRGSSAHEESFTPLPAPEPKPETRELSWINPSGKRFHVLNRFLSLDEEQDSVFGAALPLIIIGSAGSGKTVLALEKMKRLAGSVLYVTHSRFLVESARSLYYANNYENENQEIDFLSFSDFLHSVEIPPGREAGWKDFSGWFSRIRSGYKLRDPRKLFEEFRGVITGSSSQGALSEQEYISLGIKQSILLENERPEAWRLYRKYCEFLADSRLYDPNLVAVSYLERISAEYDWLVADEVQDFTIPQISLLLKSVRSPGSFIFSGDSNQIGHPNFFSWSRVKTFFYNAGDSAPKEIIRILSNNYRNSAAVTDLSNRVLLLKQKRFGSIDRESNYLVQSRSPEKGKIELLEDSAGVRTEINKKTGRSARFAVITLDDESKAKAVKIFETPLVFSIHEAKGLEYQNIVLYNLVSSAEKEFRFICEGIQESDLAGNLQYARSGDKADKSGEVYKFYINAFYVAITRSMHTLFFIEEKPAVIFDLLGIKNAKNTVDLTNEESSFEEWQREAAKLEQQGKDEQAARIKSQILKTEPVPWQVFNNNDFERLLPLALDKSRQDKKSQRAVYEYAIAHDFTHITDKLSACGYSLARRPEEGLRYVTDKYCADFTGKTADRALPVFKRYGIEYLTPIGDTPLIASLRTGNMAVTDLLLSLGAVRERMNIGNFTAQAMVLREALRSPGFAQNSYNWYTRLVSGSFTIRFAGRLRTVDSHQIEFFLLLFMIAYFRFNMCEYLARRNDFGFTAPELTKLLSGLPDEILPPYRKARPYISSVLSKNELSKQDRSSRHLFVRISHGRYAPNPLLFIEYGEKWFSIYEIAEFELICRTADESGKKLSEWMKKFINSAPKEFKH